MIMKVLLSELLFFVFCFSVNAQNERYNYKEYTHGDFTIAEVGKNSVRIFPKNFHLIDDSLRKKESQTYIEYNIPFNEDREKNIQNSPWNRWKDQIEKRIFNRESETIMQNIVDSLATTSDSLNTSIWFIVSIYFDKNGVLLTSYFEMHKHLFDRLSEEQLKRFFYESMGGDNGRKIPTKAMNCISLYGWNEEYSNVMEKNMLEFKERFESGTLSKEEQNKLFDSLVMHPKERPKASFGVFTISRHCGENKL